MNYHAFVFVPAQVYVGQFLMTLKDYPQATEGGQLQSRRGDGEAEGEPRKVIPMSRRLALLGALCSGPGGLRWADQHDPGRPQGRPARARPERHHVRRAEPADAQRALRARSLRSLRRASRGRHCRPAPGDGRHAGGSGHALRPGRAVFLARPEGQKKKLLPGGSRVRLRLSLPGEDRRSRPRAVRPQASDRGGSVQLGAHSELPRGGGVRGRPAGRHVRAALRAARGGVRSRLSTRRGP